MMRYIPAYHHGGQDNLTPTRVVIHCTVSPCQRGGAQATAGYFQSPSSGGSAHLVADPGEIVRCLPDDTVAWHAPPNQYSLGIELTDPVAGDPTRWQDQDHQAMLGLAAQAVAAWCNQYQIPIVKLSSQDLLDGKHGICGHVDVSNAWHYSDHWDPGPDFPWVQFIGLVRQAANPQPKVEDDMTPEQATQLTQALAEAKAANLRSAANQAALTSLITGLAPEIIIGIYDRRLGRKPEPAALDYWCGQLAAGKSVAWVDKAIVAAAAS